MGNAQQSFDDGNVRIYLNPDTHEIRLRPADEEERTAEEVFADQLLTGEETDECKEGGDVGSSDDDNDDVEGMPESPAFRLLTRLIGARSLGHASRRIENDRNIPPPTPMDPSCDLYNQIKQDSGESTCFSCHKNICQQLNTRQVMRDAPSHSARVATTRNMLPEHPCIVDQFTHRVYNGAYSRDGSIYICSCQDGTVSLYNSLGGRFKKYKEVMARDIGWAVIDTVLSYDNRWFAYSTWSPCIYVCNTWGDCEEKHYSLDLRPDLDNSLGVFSLRFSHDANELVAACNDGFLYVYDRTKCDRILKIDAHQDDANAVSFADDSSNIIFSGGDDGVCKAWDRRTLNESSPIPVGTFAGHKDGICFIDTKGDSRYLITNSKDQSIKLWDLRKFSSDEGISATYSKVSTQRWDYRWQNVPKKVQKSVMKKLPGDTSIMTYAGHLVKHCQNRCRFSPSETTGQCYIYTACAKGRVLIYDVLTGKTVKILESEQFNNCIRDVSWHPTEPGQLVATSWDGILQMWTYKPQPDYVEVDHDHRRRFEHHYW